MGRFQRTGKRGGKQSGGFGNLWCGGLCIVQDSSCGRKALITERQINALKLLALRRTSEKINI